MNAVLLLLLFRLYYYYYYKKLRYREEHSASVVLSWCTLWHLSGNDQQINS